MRLNLLNRRIHSWGGALAALPLLVIIGSGLLLQLKKQWSWVQPPEQRGARGEPLLDLEEILDRVQSVESLAVRGWEDVNRLDVRPGRGLAKVWLHSGWEVQVCLVTGQVLQTAFRRSDLIEAIHDGSFFGGDWTKLGLFLPAGLTLLVLWGSGLWMFLQPRLARRRVARAAARPALP